MKTQVQILRGFGIVYQDFILKTSITAFQSCYEKFWVVHNDFRLKSTTTVLPGAIKRFCLVLCFINRKDSALKCYKKFQKHDFCLFLGKMFGAVSL